MDRLAFLRTALLAPLAALIPWKREADLSEWTVETEIEEPWIEADMLMTYMDGESTKTTYYLARDGENWKEVGKVTTEVTGGTFDL